MVICGDEVMEPVAPKLGAEATKPGVPGNFDLYVDEQAVDVLHRPERDGRAVPDERNPAELSRAVVEDQGDVRRDHPADGLNVRLVTVEVCLKSREQGPQGVLVDDPERRAGSGGAQLGAPNGPTVGAVAQSPIRLLGLEFQRTG